MTSRQPTDAVRGIPAIDGAGVHLTRVLGHETAQQYDPFLMLDSFDSHDPDEYRAGFPLHPHRGIETISFVSQGAMRHRDSLGSQDTVSNGEVQWMCAGSGILHEEMIPAADRMLGVQLWLNLPQKDKMTAPHYVALSRTSIPEITLSGVHLRILAGSYTDEQGAIHRGYQSLYLPLTYYELMLSPDAQFSCSFDTSLQVVAFTLEGTAQLGDEAIEAKTAVRLIEGDEVFVKALDHPAHVLLMAAPPLHEPIAWGGPIVMNTNEEIFEAFQELEEGTFLKERITME